MSLERAVKLRWTGEGSVYEGRTGNAAPIRLDGASVAGPSPMEALLMSLAGCMAIDVAVILEKGRVQLDDLVVEVSGVRAPEPPRRFISLQVQVRATGPTEADQTKVERAVQLSHEKYCSVFHSLRPDLEVALLAVRA
jgi:putative redox protein